MTINEIDENKVDLAKREKKWHSDFSPNNFSPNDIISLKLDFFFPHYFYPKNNNSSIAQRASQTAVQGFNLSTRNNF